MSLNTKEYYNRDLSWLRFNHRVLQEAADKRNPLYERIKFLAIFSSNLDEFFKVRVSDIRQIKKLDKDLRKKLITKPNKLLKEIKRQVHIQQEEFGNIFNNQITLELRINGIELVNWTEFSASQIKFAETYFKKISKQIQNISELKGQKKNVFVENEEIYLVSQSKDKELVLVKIPNEGSRFFMLPSEKGIWYVTFIDDILKHNFSKLYKSKFYSLKISRDAELYIDNEYSGDLLTKIKNSLSNRDTGQITRALIDSEMPKTLLDSIKNLLDANETDIVRGGTYHNFKDFFGFPNPTAKLPEFMALPPKRQQELIPYESMFEAIRSKDRLFYFPYQSFEDVIRFVEEAANDDQVTKIKATLYRISTDSAIAKSLLKAAKNGKEVCVFIETKARLDEENNIKWGKILENNGAKVIYSYPGIKVHSKILYVERIENNKPRSYGYIGTGNFNEKTARIYTDFGLMSADENITSELLQVFQLLERKIIVPKTKKLLVSPFTTRSKFIELVNAEIKNSKAEKDAYIILKINSLQDPKMIDILYKANNAGVKIRLLIRGICCLVPGIKGQSENIYITSIVDRFLEHGRVYIFGNAGREKLYIGSADWMTRNLDHRIEVITPILDKDIQARIRAVVQLQLNDDVKARIIDAKQQNKYIGVFPNKQSSQHLIYKELV